MMQANPAVAAKIRSALLSLMGDPDPIVRGSAADALSPLRTDPEVRARLRAMATSDPYLSSDYRTKEGLPRYIVRETADRALNPPDAFSFYITRSPDTRACRIQPASEKPIGELYMGPERQLVLRPRMCGHYDPTGLDPQSCWLVEPFNVCTQ